MYRRAALPGVLALILPNSLGTCTVQAADIVETAEQVGQFNGFLRLLEAAEMVYVLESEGPITVFAPTDDAFDRLPPGMLDRLLADASRHALQAVVQSHIVADAAIMARDLLGRAVEVPTLGGGTLAIDGSTGIIALAAIEPSITEVEGPTVVEQTSVMTPVSTIVAGAPAISGANTDRPVTPAEQELMGVAVVAAPDIAADNGVIHGIDLVLLPPGALWSF
jgi:uncharacterized surface protein with fasciclin (FAS1) repeats